LPACANRKSLTSEEVSYIESDGKKSRQDARAADEKAKGNGAGPAKFERDANCAQ
jgi:hypothetical protein